MIYVPEFNNGNCVVVTNANTIRVYDSKPTQGRTINYRDYYPSNNYIYTDGVATFNNYSNLPICVTNDQVTTSYLYRNDIADIITTTCILIFVVYFIFRLIIKNLFRGFYI